jgi:hypothetical protein
MSRSRLDIVVPRLNLRSLASGLPEDLCWEVYGDVRPKPTEFSLMAIANGSPKPARRAVETLARYFQREFGYDLIQYSADEASDPRDRVFLWLEDRCGSYEAIGAACFRWREWENVPHGLGLAWIWIHPYLRRHGILGAHWDFFRHLYGDFSVEPPLSPAMKAFLAARNECWRCGRGACHCQIKKEAL